MDGSRNLRRLIVIVGHTGRHRSLLSKTIPFHQPIFCKLFTKFDNLVRTVKKFICSQSTVHFYLMRVKNSKNLIRLEKVHSTRYMINSPSAAPSPALCIIIYFNLSTFCLLNLTLLQTTNDFTMK
jgi:hypothetical protein